MVRRRPKQKPSRNRVLVDEIESRDQISAAFFEQNPNPGRRSLPHGLRVCSIYRPLSQPPRCCAVCTFLHAPTVSRSNWLAILCAKCHTRETLHTLPQCLHRHALGVGVGGAGGRGNKSKKKVHRTRANGTQIRNPRGESFRTVVSCLNVVHKKREICEGVCLCSLLFAYPPPSHPTPPPPPDPTPPQSTPR
jgi:hypothetical protein